MLEDFNLLATTSRGNEKPACYELLYLLKEDLGDAAAVVGKTGISGLVVAKTIFNPYEAIDKLRAILQERPYKFRYTLRVIPIERIVRTDLAEVKRVAAELSQRISEAETFRVTVEKRFTSIRSGDFIKAAAEGITRRVDLEKPDKILLIEVVGGFTGLSLIKPRDILTVVKEKLL
ncbi:MAG: THUMP domain-containing protein [Candidatus Bathyarchaeota archaeon]|nr:THUMP domain-containing protein [Candidatus Bathyarchaeota archaeon]